MRGESHDTIASLQAVQTARLGRVLKFSFVLLPG